MYSYIFLFLKKFKRILLFSEFDYKVCTMHDFLQDPINLRNRITWCYSIYKDVFSELEFVS